MMARRKRERRTVPQWINHHLPGAWRCTYVFIGLPDFAKDGGHDDPEIREMIQKEQAKRAKRAGKKRK